MDRQRQPGAVGCPACLPPGVTQPAPAAGRDSDVRSTPVRARRCAAQLTTATPGAPVGPSRCLPPRPNLRRPHPTPPVTGRYLQATIPQVATAIATLNGEHTPRPTSQPIPPARTSDHRLCAGPGPSRTGRRNVGDSEQITRFRCRSPPGEHIVSLCFWSYDAYGAAGGLAWRWKKRTAGWWGPRGFSADNGGPLGVREDRRSGHRTTDRDPAGGGLDAGD